MPYPEKVAPGQFDHCARECTWCGVAQQSFYRAYKSSDAWLCTACDRPLSGEPEEPMTDDQKSNGAPVPVSVDALLTAPIARPAEPHGLVGAAADALRPELGALRARVERLRRAAQALCDSIDDYDWDDPAWGPVRAPYERTREALAAFDAESGVP